MKDEILDYLERKYARPTIPPCPVCNKPLTMVGVLGERNPHTGEDQYETWACHASREDKDHYAKSRLTFSGTHVGDDKVVELVRRYRAVQNAVLSTSGALNTVNSHLVTSIDANARSTRERA